MNPATTLLVLDLAGVFAFALNGGLVAIRTTRVDIVGVITLAMVTALGGGILRDVLLEDLPPVTFTDWRYLGVASGAGLLAFFASARMAKLTTVVVALNAAGLGFFAVTGAIKALGLGVGSPQAIILGTLTGVGGGTVRDVLLGRVPSVLRSGLYAIPALIAAGLTVAFWRADLDGFVPAAVAATTCFAVRMVGVRYDLNAPVPRGGLTGKNLDDDGS